MLKRVGIKLAEETDLHVLARMSLGSPNEDDAFIIRNKTGDIIAKIHSLEELVEILQDLHPDDIFPNLCREDKEAEIECDIALWVHYVLGDAVLSAKIFNLVLEFLDNPEKLKLEVFNLCFNRYLNYQELLAYPGELLIENDHEGPIDL